MLWFELFKRDGVLWIRKTHRDFANTSLEGLPEGLQQYRRVTSVHLSLQGEYLEEQEFLQLCSILKENLPAVTYLHLVHLPDELPIFPQDARMAMWEDSEDKWTKLLECFPNLTKLVLYMSGLELFLIFKSIGGFKKLEEFVFYQKNYHGHDFLTYPITPKCSEILADSLEGLPNLQRVSLKGLIMHQPRACWQPLVFALGGRPNLELDIEREGHKEYIGDSNYPEPTSVDEDLWNILQNGPTLEQKLKEVQRRYNLILPGGQDLQSFLEDDKLKIPQDQDLVDTWMEALDSLFHRNNHLFYAMMNKLELIPQRQANRWKQQLFVLHQEPNQFGCFYAIFAKYPMDKWHASPFWDTANHNELIPRKNRSPVVLEKLLQEMGKNYGDLVSQRKYDEMKAERDALKAERDALKAERDALQEKVDGVLEMTADRDAWRQKFEELQGKVNALASSN